MCCLGHKCIKSAAKWMKRSHGDRCAKIKFMEGVTRGELQVMVKEKAKRMANRKERCQAKFNKKWAMQKQQEEADALATQIHKESLMIQDVQA